MDLDKIKSQSLEDLNKISDLLELEEWRIKYLGRKSELTNILRSLGEKSVEEKRTIGSTANNLRKELETLFEQKNENLRLKKLESKSSIDITRPGSRIQTGHLHPLTIVENEIKEIFSSLNFSIVEGQELEIERYNFDLLNIPKDHPARDMWDTFWVNKKKSLLMRTHTSPMQIHYMEKHEPPFQIIVPGRCFRVEATDASHEINFHQFEGLMVGEHVSLANFKFIISEFFKRFFNPSTSSRRGKSPEVRFRPSYFPFTEPSVEVDIKLSSDKWLEVMGAGMVHPNVFKSVKYDTKKFQGFAFGAGIERLAMIKYGIPDIRLFLSGDLRLIKQF